MQKFIPYFVPFMLVITLYVNGIAASGALNGIDTGEISDKYPSLFTPAGYVFSIWSLIYLGLIGFSIYQLLPSVVAKHASLVKTRWLFLINLLLNGLWILVWQYEYLVFSLPIMWGLLATLILLYEQEQIGRKQVPWNYRLLVHTPFSLYLGWISVATIANVSVVLYSLGWSGWGISDVFWTILLMGIATLLGLLSIQLRRDYVFAGVIVWALIGIAAKQQTISQIVTMSWVGVIVLVGAAISRLLSRASAKKV